MSNFTRHVTPHVVVDYLNRQLRRARHQSVDRHEDRSSDSTLQPLIYRSNSSSSGSSSIPGQQSEQTQQPVRTSASCATYRGIDVNLSKRDQCGVLSDTASFGSTDVKRPRVDRTNASTRPTPHQQPQFLNNSSTRTCGIVGPSANVPLATCVTPTTALPVSAIKIQIGSRKFKPATPVLFSSNGVQFMLQDYGHQPMMLKTQSIVKCRANLNPSSFPILFIFLKTSALQHIRTVLGLSDSDFNLVEMKCCVTVFLSFGTENTSQAQTVVENIRRSFQSMLCRFPRRSDILEELTDDQTIDLLFNSPSDSNQSTSSDVVATSPVCTLTTDRRPILVTPVVSHTTAVPAEATSTSALTEPISDQQQHFDYSLLPLTSSAATSTRPDKAAGNPVVIGCISNVQKQLRCPTATSTSKSGVSANSTVTTAAAAVTKMQMNRRTAPVFQMPMDDARWQMMLKCQSAGVTYHVVLADGRRQTWNGSCPVYKTVQVSCDQVRIGSLLAKCFGRVRIRDELDSGLFFTVNSDHTGKHSLAIRSEDLALCRVCFGSGMPSIVFMLLTNAGAEKVRNELQLVTTIDPAYNPIGPALYRRYIVLFLHHVTHDQEDSLKQLRQPDMSSPMFEPIDASQGLDMLAQIQLNTTNRSTVSRYLQSKRLTGIVGLATLAKDVAFSAMSDTMMGGTAAGRTVAGSTTVCGGASGGTMFGSAMAGDLIGN